MKIPKTGPKVLAPIGIGLIAGGYVVSKVAKSEKVVKAAKTSMALGLGLTGLGGIFWLKEARGKRGGKAGRKGRAKMHVGPGLGIHIDLGGSDSGDGGTCGSCGSGGSCGSCGGGCGSGGCGGG